jgi:glycerophosphoryl diester phosphodiesterase
MNLLRSQNKRVLIMGHRGAEGLAQENSWEAIHAGYQAGADILEIDVHLTQDGRLVVYHNYTLPDGRWVRQTRREELAQVKVAGRDLVWLDDVFDWLQSNPVCLAIDVKNGFGFELGIYQKVLALIEQRGYADRVAVLGWDHRGVQWIKQQDDRIATVGILRGRPVDVVGVAQSAALDAITWDADMITAGDVDDLHRAGVAVIGSVMVNPDYLAAVNLGVDVICCKDPGAAKKALEAH